MFFVSLTSNFWTYTVLFIVSSLLLVAWYYISIFKPYAKFPACRLEYRVPYWALTGRQLNVAILKTLVQQSKLYHEDGMFVAWIGQPILVVYGEEVVKKIVNEPAAMDKPSFYKKTEFAAGKGIFTSNGENYKMHRKLVTPAFHVSRVKSHTTTMNENAEALVKRLMSTEGRPFENIIDILCECSIKILTDTNFGEGQISGQETSLLIKLLKQMAQLVVKRMFHPWLFFDFFLYLYSSTRKCIRTNDYLRKNVFMPKLDNLIYSYISCQSSTHTPVDDLEFGGKKLKPLCEIFIEQYLQDPAISKMDIGMQLTALIIGGFDTIVHALQFALFLLGSHQEVQDRAREEVLTETEGHITYEDLSRLNYLECVIKESQRIYTVPIFGRYLQKDLQCGKYNIPRNSSVIVFTYMLHRNPEIYPDPEKFDPERFMNKNSNIKPWNYLPFAEGLRQCPGKYYAMIQMKIILAHVLRNFKIISLDRREDLELKWCLMLDFTKELRMQFIPR